MTFRRAIINGLLALVIGTILGSVSAAILGMIQDGSVWLAVTNAMFLGVGGLFIAIPFVFLYGVPLYALLLRFRLANVISAVVFGAAPGLVAWWQDDLIWQVVLMHGVAIAIVFHFLVVSGSLFRPKHLRESP